MVPTSFERLKEVYEGDKTVPSGTMSPDDAKKVDFVKSRFRAMESSKNNQQNKFFLLNALYNIFDEKVIKGHVFGEVIQFPKAWAAVQRKKAEIVEYAPEVRFTSSFDDKKDSALAANAAVKHMVNTSNAATEKARVLTDSVLYGTGIMFVGYEVKRRDIVKIPEKGSLEAFLPEGERVSEVIYDGLSTRRVDPRKFYVDETAYVLDDPTGASGARDCIEVQSYAYSTFLEKCCGEPFRNTDLVSPVGLMDPCFPEDIQETKHEIEDEKDVHGYVHLVNYYNYERDLHVIIANGILVYLGAIPFRHKQLPYVVYYNYRRDDSFWGLSELEIQAPFIYSTEVLLNLMITDAELALQPAMAVSGSLQVPKGGLRPGATLTWRGESGGSLKDSIMPLRFGGIEQSGPMMKQMLEDEMIATTGDDTRALYENPDQLATQTMAKRESKLKRIRMIIHENTVDAEKKFALMVLSLSCQFGTNPVQTLSGKVRYRRVKIEGYEVYQQDEQSEPQFIPRHGAEGHFYLNSKVLDPESYELEVIPKTDDEMMKFQQVDGMMRFLEAYNNVFSVTAQAAQMNPALNEQIEKLTSLDTVALLKQVASQFDAFDTATVFKSDSDIEDGKDIVDFEHEAIILGITPDVRPDEDSRKHLERHFTFLAKLQTMDMKPKVKKAALNALTQHINDSLENVRKQLEVKVKTPQPEPGPIPGGPGTPVPMEAPMPGAVPGGGPGMGAMPPQAPDLATGAAAAQSRGSLVQQGRALRQDPSLQGAS